MNSINWIHASSLGQCRTWFFRNSLIIHLFKKEKSMLEQKLQTKQIRKPNNDEVSLTVALISSPSNLIKICDLVVPLVHLWLQPLYLERELLNSLFHLGTTHPFIFSLLDCQPKGTKTVLVQMFDVILSSITVYWRILPFKILIQAFVNLCYLYLLCWI